MANTMGSPELIDLVSGQHRGSAELTRKIKMFLASQTHIPQTTRKTGDYEYKALCSNMLSMDPPRSIDGVRDLVEQMGQFQLWLDGATGRTSTETVAWELLMESLNGATVSGPWAVGLIKAFPDSAWNITTNVSFCARLKPPNQEEARGSWSHAVGKLIELGIEKEIVDIGGQNYGEHTDRLEGVSLLWQADDQGWMANKEQWGQIELIIQTQGEDRQESSSRQFVAFQKRQQLNEVAGVDNENVRPDRTSVGPKI